MSKRTLLIEVECGDKTCASKSGKFCEFIRTSRFGTKFHCSKFGEWNEELKEKDGWLLRHKDCLAAEGTMNKTSPLSKKPIPKIEDNYCSQQAQNLISQAAKELFTDSDPGFVASLLLEAMQWEKLAKSKMEKK